MKRVITPPLINNAAYGVNVAKFYDKVKIVKSNSYKTGMAVVCRGACRQDVRMSDERTIGDALREAGARYTHQAITTRAAEKNVRSRDPNSKK